MDGDVRCHLCGHSGDAHRFALPDPLCAACPDGVCAAKPRELSPADVAWLADRDAYMAEHYPEDLRP